MKEFHETLEYYGIRSVLFWEPDYDPPQFTALCTEPIKGDQRELFKKLNMYRK